MCSSGVHSLPFLALAISRASLNLGLSILHVCCHVLCPAHVFLSGLGNTLVTDIGGSPFVIFLYFTNCLTNHQKNLNQILIISGVLSDRYECYSKEYSCLSKTMVTCMHVTIIILNVYN